jgi:hypothetical protein
MNQKTITWVLRIAVAGEFLGHGMFGIQQKAAWVGWTQQLLGINASAAATLVFVVGVMDIILAILVLVKPIKPVILWMAVWGLWTAIMRPIVGEPLWDFIERWPNWGAPLALYLLLPRR